MTQQCSYKCRLRLALHNYGRLHFPDFPSFQRSPHETMTWDFCASVESKPLNLFTTLPFKEWVNTYSFSSKAHKNPVLLKIFHRITEQLRSEGTCEDQPPLLKAGSTRAGCAGLCLVGSEYLHLQDCTQRPRWVSPVHPPSFVPSVNLPRVHSIPSSHLHYIKHLHY